MITEQCGQDERNPTAWRGAKYTDECGFIEDHHAWFRVEVRRRPSEGRGSSMDQLDRITHRPDVMGGKACIRGMRVTVGMVVGQ
ncbi:MAG TPA: DUF433 domain-containing protein, partial [Usitatibacter sp.]|nr:DUF433 domain-containing protein [Usitatibacter sp.]